MVLFFPFVYEKEKKESIPNQISLTIEEPQPSLFPVEIEIEKEEEHIIIIEILSE